MRFVDAFDVFCKGISALTILENLLAGLLVDFKDLICTQRSKHTMHSIIQFILTTYKGQYYSLGMCLIFQNLPCTASLFIQSAGSVLIQETQVFIIILKLLEFKKKHACFLYTCVYVLVKAYVKYSTRVCGLEAIPRVLYFTYSTSKAVL